MEESLDLIRILKLRELARSSLGGGTCCCASWLKWHAPNPTVQWHASRLPSPHPVFNHAGDSACPCRCMQKKQNNEIMEFRISRPERVLAMPHGVTWSPSILSLSHGLQRRDTCNCLLSLETTPVLTLGSCFLWHEGCKTPELYLGNVLASQSPHFNGVC